MTPIVSVATDPFPRAQLGVSDQLHRSSDSPGTLAPGACGRPIGRVYHPAVSEDSGVPRVLRSWVAGFSGTLRRGRGKVGIAPGHPLRMAGSADVLCGEVDDRQCGGQLLGA